MIEKLFYVMTKHSGLKFSEMGKITNIYALDVLCTIFFPDEGEINTYGIAL